MVTFRRILLALPFVVSQLAVAKTPVTLPDGFAMVTHGIYRGARPVGPEESEVLSQMGVKTVLDLQGGDYSNVKYVGSIIPYFEKGETPAEIATERDQVVQSGMFFLNIPMTSIKPVDDMEAARIEEILKTLSNQALWPIYIHCAHGHDRTGLIVALYRMKYQNWPADMAYAEMRRMGHSLVNMITTWPMDAYFFKYANKLADERGEPHPIVSAACEYNLAF